MVQVWSKNSMSLKTETLSRKILRLWFAKNACGPNARVSISIATGFWRPGEAECRARNVVLHGSRPTLLTCSLT
jgi:hypothetical protein